MTEIIADRRSDLSDIQLPDYRFLDAQSQRRESRNLPKGGLDLPVNSVKKVESLALHQLLKGLNPRESMLVIRLASNSLFNSNISILEMFKKIDSIILAQGLVDESFSSLPPKKKYLIFQGLGVSRIKVLSAVLKIIKTVETQNKSKT